MSSLSLNKLSCIHGTVFIAIHVYCFFFIAGILLGRKNSSASLLRTTEALRVKSCYNKSFLKIKIF